MKKNYLLCLLVGMLSIQSALAYDFELDGFYYNLNLRDMMVSVTHGEKMYEGDVIVPDSITYRGKTMKVVAVGDSAFRKCTKLTSIHFGDNVSYIGERAFEGCTSLSKLTIPSTFSKSPYDGFSITTNIDHGAFYGCTALEELTIDDSESNLRFGTNGGKGLSDAFNSKLRYLYYGCKISGGCDLDNSRLATIVIGSKVTEIEGFGGSIISQITIPASVTFIENGTFKGCERLKYVYFEDSKDPIALRSNVSLFDDCPIKGAYIGRRFIEKVLYGKFEEGLGPFNGTSITDVTISDSLTYLCRFYNCKNLKKIDIPASVTELYGFKGCDSLVSINVKSANPPSVTNPFFSYLTFESNVFLNATLYVPKGSKEKYQSDDMWGKFFDIQEVNSSPSSIKKCEKPLIRYDKGALSFSTETEGAICHSVITDPDITSYNTDEVQLGVTYTISVYATRPGFENSDIATATLCWIDVEPKTEGISNGIANIKANPVLIQTENGLINVTGAGDGVKVAAYTVNGVQVGSATSYGGQAQIATTLQSGSIAILKIGKKSVKITIK